ncbi:hypothetical protein KC316_g6989 [Hortaea werneckii]|nr:hypothetical protein KC324_g7091 [Hortaea werneckii]KAI7583953.1 hypothetical protein KC316_g6989 [Hortaea werneckii]
MEAAAFGLTVISLAGLFDSAVNAFRYVQVGKAYGLDVQSSCLLLDNAQLRLSRWGQAIGLGTVTDGPVDLQETSFSEADVQRARMLLEHILDLFKEAEAKSLKMQGSRSPSEAIDLEATLPPGSLALRRRVNEVCRRRQRSPGLIDKAKWAIYGKEHFEALVSTVNRLVGDLVELFPTTRQAQQELCEQEVREMSSLTTWPDFLKTAEATDTLMANAAIKVQQQAVGIPASPDASKLI